MSNSEIDEAHISEAAYYIWISEGQPEGCGEEHWARAIEVLEAAKPKPKKARKAAAKPRAPRKTAAAKPRATKTKATAAAKKPTKS